MSFPADVLEVLREARTVRIETRRGPGRPVRSTIIWIVVDDADRVLVRSVRGERGRWYRELVANPEGAIQLPKVRIPIRAEPAVDPDRMAACSRALEVKYRTSRGSLASMLLDEVLPTTLELRPA